MTTVVFLGPTLPRDDARRILPDAVYLPPARQADIVTAIGRYHPDVIALIDGTFLHTLAVWHKEILHALDLGIRVFGASSMGALRAAECAEFGMVGVGRVFRDYADGTLTADDEVALSHADEASGWRPMSEAMVNVRATLTAAVAAGVLTEGEKDAVTAAGKALYFPERTWPAILARSGLDAAARRRVTKFAARHGVDLKRLDAEELLRTVAGLGAAQLRHRDWTFHETSAFQGLMQRDRRVARDAGEVSFEAIGRHAMLHIADAADLLDRASAREQQQLLADFLGIMASDDDVRAETERFRRRRGFSRDADFAAYLDRCDMTEAEFAELMRRLAVGRMLRDRLRVRSYRTGLTQLLLDELRLRDEYAQWADSAALHEAVLASIGEPESLDAFPDLAQDHLECTAWSPDCDGALWAQEADFGHVDQLHAELARARAVRRHLAELAQLQQVRALLRDLGAMRAPARATDGDRG